MKFTSTPTKIILASQSPRRIELLTELGLKFTTDPSDFTEKDIHETPEELAIHNANGKAREVAARHRNSIIIAADTIGVVEGQILGKPRDREHARELIRAISGTTHEVITGICVLDTSSDREQTQAITTKVFMSPLTSKEIEFYLDSNEWHDKAAAYAIQGLGALFIEKIEGDYFNVVGLPIFTLRKMLEALDVKVLRQSNDI